MESPLEQLQAAWQELKQLTEAYLDQVGRMLEKDPFAHGRVRAFPCAGQATRSSRSTGGDSGRHASMTSFH
jgi:hypothetical protein